MAKNQTSRMGSMMLLIAWLCFMGLLTFMFSKWLEHSNNSNQSLNSTINQQGFHQVVLHANRYNHYVVTGKINGVEVTFMVDTGASNVSIPMHLSNKLGLEKGNVMRAHTAGGIVNVYATKIDKLEIGNISLTDIRASLNPNEKTNEILLGMSALKKLTFKQSNGKLILEYLP